MATARRTQQHLRSRAAQFLSVLLVDRSNIASGTTTIHTAEGALLGSFTQAVPSHSDVLVVTFQQSGAGTS